MRRPEGIAPRVRQSDRIRLGAPPKVVFEGSLSAALLLVIGVFLFFPDIKSTKRISVGTQEVVTIEEVEHTRQEHRAPPPPRPPIPVEAPGDADVEDVEIASTELMPTEEVAPPPPASADEDEQYFVVVEEMPRIVGGVEALARVLQYPELAIRAGVQGRVYVLAYVDETGRVTKTELIKGIGAGCDEAAMEAVKKVTFIPGRQRGLPVKVKVSVPVVFRLTTS
ncbi:MAG: TonB family protein [Ignavibacterium sp.]|jgi:protein TonB